jgi:hypothetical protein
MAAVGRCTEKAAEILRGQLDAQPTSNSNGTTADTFTKFRSDSPRFLWLMS